MLVVISLPSAIPRARATGRAPQLPIVYQKFPEIYYTYICIFTYICIPIYVYSPIHQNIFPEVYVCYTYICIFPRNLA